MPYGFFCRYMKDLTFRDITIAWEEISGPWSSAIRCDQVDGLMIRNLTGRQAYVDGDQPVIQLRNVAHALIQNAWVREKSSCFVQVYGAASKDIRIAGNDLDGLVGEIAVTGRSADPAEVKVDGQPQRN